MAQIVEGNLRVTMSTRVCHRMWPVVGVGMCLPEMRESRKYSNLSNSALSPHLEGSDEMRKLTNSFQTPFGSLIFGAVGKMDGLAQRRPTLDTMIARRDEQGRPAVIA